VSKAGTGVAGNAGCFTYGGTGVLRTETEGGTVGGFGGLCTEDCSRTKLVRYLCGGVAGRQVPLADHHLGGISLHSIKNHPVLGVWGLFSGLHKICLPSGARALCKMSFLPTNRHEQYFLRFCVGNAKSSLASFSQVVVITDLLIERVQRGKTIPDKAREKELAAIIACSGVLLFTTSYPREDEHHNTAPALVLCASNLPTAED
jgi:hypothetical protein